MHFWRYLLNSEFVVPLHGVSRQRVRKHLGPSDDVFEESAFAPKFPPRIPFCASLLLQREDPTPHASLVGGVPTTPDPNTSAKVSRYKWEAYRDTNWWCIYYFLPQGGHTFTKVCHRNGRCIAILFRMYWGQGSIWLSWFKESVIQEISNILRVVGQTCLFRPHFFQTYWWIRREFKGQMIRGNRTESLWGRSQSCCP